MKFNKIWILMECSSNLIQLHSQIMKRSLMNSNSSNYQIFFIFIVY